jgi:hypothetical protein
MIVVGFVVADGEHEAGAEGAARSAEPDSADRQANRCVAGTPLCGSRTFTRRSHFLVSRSTSRAASGRHVLMHPSPALWVRTEHRYGAGTSPGVQGSSLKPPPLMKV